MFFKIPITAGGFNCVAISISPGIFPIRLSRTQPPTKRIFPFSRRMIFLICPQDCQTGFSIRIVFSIHLRRYDFSVFKSGRRIGAVGRRFVGYGKTNKKSKPNPIRPPLKFLTASFRVCPPPENARSANKARTALKRAEEPNK